MHMALEHWMVTILFWRIIPKKEKEGGIERKMNFNDATEKVITIIGTKILKILEEIYPESEFPTEYTHLEV